MGIAPTLSGIQNSSGLVSRKKSQKRGELYHYGGVIVALLQLVAPEGLVRVITHMLRRNFRFGI